MDSIASYSIQVGLLLGFPNDTRWHYALATERGFPIHKYAREKIKVQVMIDIRKIEGLLIKDDDKFDH